MDASYNNFGGTNNGALPVTSSGQGDIILTHDAPKAKSKKWIVVVVIVLVLMAIGGAVAWVLISEKIASDKAFKEYRDLVLYKDNKSNEYPTNDGLYAIQNAYIGNNEENVKYFSSIKDAEKKLTESTVNKYKDAIDIVSLWIETNVFYNVGDVSLDAFYEQNGYDSTLVYTKENVLIYIDSTNEKIKKGGEYLLDAKEKYIKFIDAYEKNGCKITEKTDECINREYEINDSYRDDMNKSSLLAFNYMRVLLDEAVMQLVESQ